jgi:hypothetical protein
MFGYAEFITFSQQDLAFLPVGKRQGILSNDRVERMFEAKSEAKSLLSFYTTPVNPFAFNFYGNNCKKSVQLL